MTFEMGFERGYIKYYADHRFVTFVSKLQKAKTRKDKEYFILRTTMPKEIAEKIDVQAGDFVIFKAKKAEWFNLLDWDQMKDLWAMLPTNVKKQAMMDGTACPSSEIENSLKTELPAATNLAQLPVLMR